MNSYFLGKTSFERKVRTFSYEYLECCNYISSSFDCNYPGNKSLYLKLSAASRNLDDFLNFHRAAYNTHWQFYTKMCSLIKCFSTGAYWHKHISKQYFSDKTNCHEKIFSQKIEETSLFFNQVLVRTSNRILIETKELKLPAVQTILNSKNFPSTKTSDILEKNTILKTRTVEKQDIVKISNDFLSLVLDFEKIKLALDKNLKQPIHLVPNEINVTNLKYLTVVVNNLRILFHTYTNKANLDDIYSKLTDCLNNVYYLLKMAISLLQFYEQTYLSFGLCNNSEKIKKELFLLVNPKQILYYVIEFGFLHSCTLLSYGKNLIHKIISKTVKMSSIKVKIPKKYGFHTRPSLLVAKIVQHYGSKVYLEVGNDKFDASSVLKIQWAGGKIQREKISEVIFSGDIRALNDIKLLASINYGEELFGKELSMPYVLDYLK